MRGWLRVGNERMVKGAEKGGGLGVGNEGIHPLISHP
jgi:hypothetical protein